MNQLLEVEKLINMADMGRDEDHVQTASAAGAAAGTAEEKKDFYGVDHDLLKSEIIEIKKKEKNRKKIKIVEE